MVWLSLLVLWALSQLDNLLARMDKVVDDLVRQWKIDDTEELAIVKIDDIEQLSLKRFWLVGKLLTSKPYCALSLINKMKNIWKISGEVSISEWKGSDRLLFCFRNEIDRTRVMRGGPWKFDNAMLVLSCTDGGADPCSVQLNTQNFWIRIRGFPPKLLSKAMGTRLGNILGFFVEFDPNTTGDCTGNFLRVRVRLDISKPLRKWINLDLSVEEVSRLRLDYEEIPYFCLFCGRLSHISNGCPLAREGLITEPRFGRWRTLAKHVFNIEPDGQLLGTAFGLTKKKTPWRMQAPEPTLGGAVRPRASLEEEDTVRASLSNTELGDDRLDGGSGQMSK